MCIWVVFTFFLLFTVLPGSVRDAWARISLGCVCVLFAGNIYLYLYIYLQERKCWVAGCAQFTSSRKCQVVPPVVSQSSR